MKREMRLIIQGIVLLVLYYVASKVKFMPSGFFYGCILGLLSAAGGLSILEAIYHFIKRKTSVNQKSFEQKIN